MKHIVVGGLRLEYVDYPARDARLPVILMLHEGLGCVAMWRHFPERVAATTGCRVIAWSRAGYGHSQPWPAPPNPRYMHREALERPCQPCSPHCRSSARCFSGTVTAPASR